MADSLVHHGPIWRGGHTKGRSSGPIRDTPRTACAGGRIEQWQSQPREGARSALAASSRRSASAVAALLGFVDASAGAPALAGLLLLTAVGLGLYARHWLTLARRSRVGARSEDEVQRTLAALQAEGWRLRHSLPWQGGGDIDSVAISPTGIG